MTAKIYLDTNIFIDAFERRDSSHSQIWDVLNAIEQGQFQAVTSEITLAELLPKLIADGESELISLYERLFLEKLIFDAAPVTLDILVKAAHLRAVRMSLRLPDAIHLATAAAMGCCVVLSNDQRLNLLGDVPVVAVGPDCLSIIWGAII